MEKTGAAQNFQLVDFYGFLRPLYRIMPARFSTYKRTLLEINEIEDRLFFKLLNIAKDNIEKGKVYPSEHNFLCQYEENRRRNSGKISLAVMFLRT